MKRYVTVLWAAFVTLLYGAVYYYIALPALNPADIGLWIFALMLIGVFAVTAVLVGIIQAEAVRQIYVNRNARGGKRNAFAPIRLPAGSRLIIRWAAITAGALLGLMLILALTGARIFNAERYHRIITVTPGVFSEDVASITMNQIPVVDHDSASRLGSRKLGELSDLVSQFEIDNVYAQINYNSKPYRVTPLVYGDFIKWINNKSKGIPAYLLVDMVTQEAELVRLPEGQAIKYSPSELWGRDLTRHLRFLFPTKIFGEVVFEIDENGTPYWIADTLTYTIGWRGGSDTNGAVLVNAITGEGVYYPLAEIPAWVDRVFDADTIIRQLGYYGGFGDGFWNAVFGQKGVLMPTAGYNYIAVNDDIFLYTGMTSVAKDESNVGFVLVNLRTKETKYYALPGAEEYSAMSSAEGKVQHLGYTSTFPLLLNIADRPTYFVSLKDAAGLVKMYAFVDVQQYQLVGTGATVGEAQADYLKVLRQEDGVVNLVSQAKTGVIAAISPVVLDGSTVYYFMLEGADTVYTAGITQYDRLPFLQPGDTVSFTAVSGTDGSENVIEFTSQE